MESYILSTGKPLSTTLHDGRVQNIWIFTLPQNVPRFSVKLYSSTALSLHTEAFGIVILALRHKNSRASITLGD